MPTPRTPPTRLQLARQRRGLTQQELADALRQLGWDRHRQWPAVDALMVSKWERGAKRPSPFYRDLLVAFYDTSPEQLGLRPTPPAAPEPLASVPATVSTATTGAEVEPWQLLDALTRTPVSLDVLREMTAAAAGYARRFPHATPTELLAPIRRQLARVDDALQQPASWAARRECTELLATLTGFAGNLYLDLGQPEQATAYLRVARVAARQAGNPELEAWVLAVRSIVAFHSNDPRTAVDVIEEARRVGPVGSGTRLAWMLALEGRAYAALHAARRSDHALGRAADAVASPALTPNPTDFFDDTRLAALAGSCHLLLGRPRHARPLLDLALAHRPLTEAKGRALIHLDLARCDLAEDNPDGAAHRLITIVESGPSVLIAPVIDAARRTIRRLHDIDPSGDGWQQLNAHLQHRQLTVLQPPPG